MSLFLWFYLGTCCSKIYSVNYYISNSCQEIKFCHMSVDEKCTLPISFMLNCLWFNLSFYDCMM